MRILGIIPARYASSRFPGKALADIGGTTMIERVYRQVEKSVAIESIIVATDHSDIYDHVYNFGGKAVLTSDQHVSGTDRCVEALEKSGFSADYVINIQGDEPFIDPEQVDQLAGILLGSDKKTEIATLAKPILDPDSLFDPNVVKLIKNRFDEAIYFSRMPIPYQRHAEKNEWVFNHRYYKHLGIYGYRSDILPLISQLPMGLLEKAESLEQLRWLENGYHIRVAITELESIGIDTPEDLEKAKQIFGI